MITYDKENKQVKFKIAENIIKTITFGQAC